VQHKRKGHVDGIGGGFGAPVATLDVVLVKFAANVMLRQ